MAEVSAILVMDIGKKGKSSRNGRTGIIGADNCSEHP
jgi:hypothetical protein